MHNLRGELNSLPQYRDIRTNTIKIFVGSSSRAENDVMGKVYDIVNKYKKKYQSKVDVYYWKDSHKSGDIMDEIIEEIRTSQIGILYMSEKKDQAESSDTEIKYQDNPNVLFEAGIFHAFSKSIFTEDDDSNLNSIYQVKKWIPIREENSDKTPFDFAQERKVIVRRYGEEGVNLEQLENDLNKRLDACLEYFKTWFES